MGSYGPPEPVTGIFGKALARGCAQKPNLLTLSLTHPPNTPVPWEAKESKRLSFVVLLSVIGCLAVRSWLSVPCL